MSRIKDDIYNDNETNISLLSNDDNDNDNNDNETNVFHPIDDDNDIDYDNETNVSLSTSLSDL